LYPAFAVSAELYSALRVCGLGLLCIGVPVYVVFAVRFARSSRDGALVTTGPYARVRHPLYAVWIFLLVPGAALLVGSWLLLSVPPVMYVAARVFLPSEEAGLENRHGDVFREYRCHTGRLLPTFGRQGPRDKPNARANG
jgi:protein-S-isoprenylcysteine O-methyltransferase Ste14